MGVSHGRSRVADLRFQIWERTIHPDWFVVRAHQRLVQDRWEADLRIIDGGHALLVRSGHIRVAEVLTGPETELPESGRIIASSVRHERTARLSPAGGISYQACTEVERVDPEVFAHLSDEMTLDARGRLFHRFAPINRLAPAPISHLRYEVRPRGFTLHTFHSFPDDRAIVRTQSLFEIE